MKFTIRSITVVYRI